jgi:cell wall-associated NlpC family hydrolase
MMVRELVISYPVSQWRTKTLRNKLIIGIASLMLFVSVPVIISASTPDHANIVKSVSFRTAPSTSSTVLKYIKAGQTVSVLEVMNEYWLKVKDQDGKVGYISAQDKYVNLATGSNTNDNNNTNNNGNTGSKLESMNALAVTSVAFRREPATSSSRIRYLKKNEKVTITKVVNSYWYAITDSSGVSGYVSSQDRYIQVTGSLPEQPKPIVVAPVTSSPAVRDKVIAAGMRYLGTRYEYGSDRNTTTTFDCSDFVRQAFKDALGIVLPASSSSQGDYVREKNQVTTNWESLKRGDLMFFMDYKGAGASNYANKSTFGEKITHVGIYLGNGQVLHTYSISSGGVRTNEINNTHWENRFLFGGSAL